MSGGQAPGPESFELRPPVPVPDFATNERCPRLRAQDEADFFDEEFCRDVGISEGVVGLHRLSFARTSVFSMLLSARPAVGICLRRCRLMMVTRMPGTGQPSVSRLPRMTAGIPLRPVAVAVAGG